MLVELRDTIWAMNKNGISLEDLQVRVSNFIDKAHFASRTTQFNFEIDKSLSPNLKFSSVKGMNIYRIIQEAVNNAIKYAEASLVNVQIYNVENAIEFKITDNGIGFDKTHIDFGNGLNNMKKRAEEINAQIKIESQLGKGTQIVFTIEA